MSEQFPLQLRYCSWMCVLQGQGKQNSISYYCTRRENWLKAKFRQKQAVPYPAITCLSNVNRHGFSCYQTMLCHEHRPDSPAVSDLVLSSYAVYRRVYVNRDEIQQIARWVWQQTIAFIFSQNGDTASYTVHAEQSLFCLRMIRNIKTYTSRCCCTFISVIGFLPLVIFSTSMLRHNQETNDKPQTLRVGSLVVKSLGQLLPHQLQSFHTRDAVYPVSSCVLFAMPASVLGLFRLMSFVGHANYSMHFVMSLWFYSTRKINFGKSLVAYM